MKFKLVDDWKYAWRWVSINCMLVSAAIQGAWMYIPDDMRKSLPQQLVSGITLGLLAIGVAGRLLKQRKRHE